MMNIIKLYRKFKSDNTHLNYEPLSAQGTEHNQQQCARTLQKNNNNNDKYLKSCAERDDVHKVGAYDEHLFDLTNVTTNTHKKM